MTVSLINIPLSVSLAVAAQSTPAAGIITGVWAGLVGSLAGGSSFNVTGATGALVGILTTYALKFGAGCLPVLCLTSSLLTFAVYALRWHRFIRFLPSAVVHGFTLAVALIIMAGQLSNCLGIASLPPSPHALLSVVAVLANIGRTDPRDALVFALSWSALYLLVRVNPRVPWSLPIAAAGIGLGWLSSLGYAFPLQTLRDRYGDMSLFLFSPPSLSSPALQLMLQSPADVVAASASIAFVGVLESLISGRLADAITHSEMDARQEVLALGLANLASGLAGGIPATAALARTALSIRSGARSRVAGVVNALLTGALALFILPVFGFLPLCVVAALLFQVGVGMMESQHLRDAYLLDVAAFRLTLLVVLLSLLFDPTVGIVGGAAIGLLSQAEQTARGYSEVITNDDDDAAKSRAASRRASLSSASSSSSPSSSSSSSHGLVTAPSSRPHSPHSHSQRPPPSVAVYRIVGDLSYLSALTHTARLRRLRLRCSHLMLSFRFCHYIDLDGLHSLRDSVHDLQSSGCTVVFCSVASQLQPILCRSLWYLELQKQGKVFPRLEQAMCALESEGAVSRDDIRHLRAKLFDARRLSVSVPV